MARRFYIEEKDLASGEIERFHADTEGRSSKFTERLISLSQNPDPDHRDYSIVLIEAYLEHHYYWYEFRAAFSKLRIVRPLEALFLIQAAMIAIMRCVPSMTTSYANEYVKAQYFNLTGLLFDEYLDSE